MRLLSNNPSHLYFQSRVCMVTAIAAILLMGYYCMLGNAIDMAETLFVIIASTVGWTVLDRRWENKLGYNSAFHNDGSEWTHEQWDQFNRQFSDYCKSRQQNQP